jgi:hypothetical protein
MTTLSAAIASTKPREKSGARTSARYAFQNHVSLAKVLDLHKTGADYRVILDHFDDLVILETSIEPMGMEFYQIKGKQAGSWTASQLCSISGDFPRTTVGKMYHHVSNFGDAVRAMVFLSNAPFKFTLHDGTKTTPDHNVIAYCSLGSTDRAQFTKVLDLDFPPPRKLNEAALIKFELTGVPLTDYDVFLKGRLVDFVEDRKGVAVSALYRTLISDVTQKSNNTTECRTLADVFSNKSLCRADFETVFSAAESHRNILEHWSMIDEELAASGRSGIVRMQIKTEVVDYIRESSKRTPEAVAISVSVRAVIDQIKDQLAAVSGLVEAASMIGSAMMASAISQRDQIRLDAAILVEAFEALHG